MILLEKIGLKLKLIDRCRQLALYVFIALLGYEYWNKLSIFGGMTMPKLAGLLYFSLAMLTPKKMLAINKKDAILFGSLLVLWVWLAFASLMTYILYNSELTLQLSFLQLIILFWLVINEIRNDFAVERNIKIAFIVGVFFIFILINMGVGLQSSRESEVVDDIENVTRIWFMGLNPNSLGNLAALAFILSLTFIEDLRNKFTFLLIFPMLAFLNLVMFSGSAGALLLLSIGCILFFMANKPSGYKLIIYYSVAAITAVFFISFFSSSEHLINKLSAFFLAGETSGRAEIWMEIINLTAKNPILGVGHTYRTAHNVFLDMFKWGGVVALFFFLFFLALTTKMALSSFFYSKNSLPIILVVSVSFILLKSGGGLNLKYVWVVLALAVASSHKPIKYEKDYISR